MKKIKIFYNFFFIDPKLIYIGRIIHDIEINIWERKVMKETYRVQDAITKIISETKDKVSIIKEGNRFFDNLYNELQLSDIPSSHPESGRLVDPLSERELSILRLMAAGLSHDEIARELYLSVNTVKWHTTHIYRKLGVHRRAHAVFRAKELDIL